MQRLDRACAQARARGSNLRISSVRPLGRIGRVILVGIEVRLVAVGFIRVRNSIPAQAQVQSEPVVYAPVVLNVGIWGNGVPGTRALVTILGIMLCVAQDEVGIVQSAGYCRRATASRGTGSRSVKSEATLGFGKVVLHLLVERPAKSKLELMCSLYPGQIIANLIVIRGVVPRQPVHAVVSVGTPGQIDVGDAVVNIGSGEDPVRSLREARDIRCRIYALGQDGNAIAVVVEGNLVEQVWPNRVGCVHHRAVGGITERVTDGRDAVAAPHCLTVCLRGLIGNPMAEDGELVRKVMVNTSNLFLAVSGLFVAANELPGSNIRGLRENSRTQ